MPDGLLWAYGIVPGGREVDVEGVGGVSGGGLTMLARRLPFSAGELQRRLEDPEQVAVMAREHHAVLDTVMKGGDVIPLRMGTVYASREAIRAVLVEEGPRLARVLERLRGHAEWGVKGYLLPFAPAAPASSGTDYLRSRLAQRDHGNASADAAATLHDRLAAASSEAVLAPVRTREREQPMVLNGAYLLPHGDAEAFAALVGRLGRGDAGLQLELTGPWPPYHFV
jgi:hypothetical protein